MRIKSKVPLILPLTLFLLSGFAGLWPSYDPENSFTKFMLILSGIFLYVVIVMLRGKDQLLIRLTRVFLVITALFALYFDTQYDFAAHPSKFSLLNQLGVFFNNLVPQLQLFDLNRDTVVGVMEIALPLNIAVLLDVWIRKRRVSIVFMISALLILFGLISSSMRSLSVLGAVYIIALTIYLVTKIRGHVHFSALIWILITIAIIFGIGFLLLIIYSSSHLNLAEINSSIISHMDFNWRTWRLIQAYFFTGSGLGVFTMVLSTYSLLIQVPFVPHAENTFLQIWIEQGLLGLIAFVWLVFAFYVWVWKRRNQLNVPAMGALIATTTMLFPDLIDVSLYSTVWLPLMFVPIGLTVASTGHSSVRKLPGIWNRQRVTGTFFVIILGSALGWKLILPAWYTNLGSISQTRLELGQYKFPDRLAEYTRRNADYSKIEPYFRKALAVDPGNVSANQRLAMLKLEREDYNGAVKLLKTAYARDSKDPVTLQLLGSAYLGCGRLDEACAFWSRLPDATTKLDLEAWVRYETRGDKERAYQARKLATKIMAEQKLKQ